MIKSYNWTIAAFKAIQVKANTIIGTSIWLTYRQKSMPIANFEDSFVSSQSYMPAPSLGAFKIIVMMQMLYLEITKGIITNEIRETSWELEGQ